MESGDDNTTFFHAFAKGRKSLNAIWKLNTPEGEEVSSFEGMANEGIRHFSDIFKEIDHVNMVEVVKMAHLFPGFADEMDNRALMVEVTKGELKAVLSSFQKDKSPSPDGWTIEFFISLYEIIGGDLLKAVEGTRTSGRIPASFNATFIALIPKTNSSTSLNDFRPISLCNCVYKVVSKIISRRLKVVLSHHISEEQYGFLEGRQIHEVIGVSQEGMHSLKSHKLKGVILKIDFSKAYDKVSWVYIRIILTHLGFKIGFIRWIMSCITSVSFSVLINGSASPFFHAGRGLRQGFPLSPLLFLMVAEGLSRALEDAKNKGLIHGVQISPNLQITHLLFVDDVLMYGSSSEREAGRLREILSLFSKATGMEVNENKATLSTNLLGDQERHAYSRAFPYSHHLLEDGLKYLGLNLKPNDYQKHDWKWLLEKLEKRIFSWSHKWLSRAGWLVLVKSVLEAILVYWMSFSWIPKGILEAARKILCSRFLWSGKEESHVTPWVRWDCIALPKSMGGWGLKNIFHFSKALAAKGGWRLIKTSSLWTQVLSQKYLAYF